MDFMFSHDGQTFHLHTENGEAECDEVAPQPQPTPPLEPSGDPE